jgi:hypothetical protein
VESSVLSGPFLERRPFLERTLHPRVVAAFTVCAFTAAPAIQTPHCEINICDVLDMVSIRRGTNGITSGNVYCTVT